MVPSVEQILEELKARDEITDSFLSNLSDAYNLEYRSGAFKYCIYHKDWDQVIKISHLDSSVKIDPCLDECRVYETSSKFGIQMVLLKAQYICTLENGQGIMTQEKATVIHNELTYQQEKKYKNMVKTLSGNCYKERTTFYQPRMPSLWLKAAIVTYGRKRIVALAKWTRAVKIYDLHSGNIGYRHGKPVIIDYAKN